MIDHSPPGSWVSILPHCTQVKVQDYDPFAAQLERNLAARRAARAETNPHRRGHITRQINSEAKNASDAAGYGTPEKHEAVQPDVAQGYLPFPERAGSPRWGVPMVNAFNAHYMAWWPFVERTGARCAF